MLPQRPTGSFPAVNAAARRSGSIPYSQTQSFEGLKARVLAKLEDRLDPGTSKRMPSSLLRQSIRTHAEQVTDHEARGLPRPDRERMVDEVLAELLGYGPLNELFRDPTVREIMVTSPNSIIVRRENSQWLPTSIKYRDEEHVRWTLEKLVTHADPVGGILMSLNLFDLQLPNGFRAIAVIPPAALGQHASAAFIRTETLPSTTASSATSEPAQPQSGQFPVSATISPSVAAARPTAGTISASPRPGSGIVSTPLPRVATSESTSGTSPDLTRHRNKIIERLISKMASLGVYDIQRVEITEFRKVVTAYVREYVEHEKIYLSEADQCRLMLEILTAMQR